MSRFRTLDDLDVTGKRVLVRVDLNVPVKNGTVTDATRIERSAETLEELAAKGARVIVLAHFGRPKGRDQMHSLAQLLDDLQRALPGRVVKFCPEVGDAARAAVERLAPGQLLLLENLRFWPGEEGNDPAFIRNLATLGELYVNDAFSAAHRAHASTAGLATVMPAVAGRLMQAEIEALEAALGGDPEGVIALIGGSKVSTKIDILRNLSRKVEALVIGGAMANTFRHAQGHEVGASLVERDLADTARDILANAEANHCEVMLPVDYMVAPAIDAGDHARIAALDAVTSTDMILDLGPASLARIVERFDRARILVWNGPVGAFEFPPFDRATVELARAAAERTDAGRLRTIAGGGDTNAALAHAGVVDRFSYVSTAGGAFLEWLEGRALPGVDVLRAI